jgi:lambda family phage portal protein
MIERDSTRSVGWFTRALSTVAPEAARRRLASRMQFEHMSRGYAAARPVQGGKVVRNSSKAANVEIGEDLSRIRNLARQLVRDNPWASSAMAKSAAHIVGTGIYARAKAPKVWRGVELSDQERNIVQAIANDRFDRFADECDPLSGGNWYGQQSLAARAWRESGEVLTRWSPRDNIPDQIVEVLECDFLDSTITSYHGRASSYQVPEGHKAVQGVEFGPDKSRMFYHLFDDHPGDYGSTLKQAQRVDARHVDHIYQPLRPGQVRGVSAFAPVAMKLGLLGDLSEYGAQAAVMQALVGMVVKVDDAADPASRPIGDETTDANGQRQTSLKPGFVWTGNPGESIEAFTPGGLGVQLMAQMDFELTAVAAGLDMPRHVITGDVSKSSYSTLRASKLDYDAMLMMWQWLVLIPRMIAPAWRRQMRIASLTLPNGQDSRLSEIVAACGAVYTPPLSPNVDPLKDVTAQIAEIRSGLLSLPDALGARGTTLEDQIADIARSQTLLDANGIILDTDPRRTAGTGGLQPAQVLNLNGA